MGRRKRARRRNRRPSPVAVSGQEWLGAITKAITKGELDLDGTPREEQVRFAEAFAAFANEDGEVAFDDGSYALPSRPGLERRLRKLRRRSKQIERDLRAKQREMLRNFNWAYWGSKPEGQESILSYLDSMDWISEEQRIVCRESFPSLERWADNGYPRFTVTEGLAASLAATELAAEFEPPFDAFGVTLPFSIHDAADWRDFVAGCTEAGEWWVIIPAATGHRVVESISEIGLLVPVRALPHEVQAHLLTNLCSYIAAVPSSMRKRRGTSGSSKKRKPAKPNDWIVDTVNRVRLDGTERVIEQLSAGKLPGPTFKIGKRFMVRGHWRNQACGPGRKLRRRRWIAPYLKGPDEGEAWSKVYEVGR